MAEVQLKWSLLVSLVAVIPVGCAKQPDLPARAKQPPTMLRQAFQDAVLDKTTDEVVAAIGQPNSTTDIGKPNSTTDATGKPNSTTDAYTLRWTYMSRTVDPATGKTDSHTDVHFQTVAGKLVVKNVTFGGAAPPEK
jgi:hypothetical protein